MSNLASALNYHTSGLCVIPIRGKDKRPAISSWKEFQTMRPPVDAIRDHYTKNPDDGIGIVTGRVSGVTVIDIDIKDIPKDELAKQLTAIINAIVSDDPLIRKGYAVVITGSGGAHIYTRYIDIKTQLQIDSQALVPGTQAKIDIKSDGGYVIAPPSVHPNGREYTLHPSFNDLQDLSTLKTVPKPILRLLQREDEKNREVDWNKIISQTTSGSRNNSVAKVFGLLMRHMPPEHWETVVLPVVTAWNAQFIKPPLMYKEVEAIYRSIGDRSIQRFKLDD